MIYVIREAHQTKRKSKTMHDRKPHEYAIPGNTRRSNCLSAIHGTIISHSYTTLHIYVIHIHIYNRVSITRDE